MSESPLHQIMYTSTSAEPMDVTSLSALLAQAREKNARLDVTGMLLYRRGSFLQLIEGAEETLKQLYATIQADERHRSVITLLDAPADTRDFPDWQMGFRHLGDLHPSELPEGFSPFMSADFDTSEYEKNPSFGQQMLLGFRSIEA